MPGFHGFPPESVTFFQNLHYVVVDEAHVYRGVFGSHVGCVLRRLRRVCEVYGSQPQFIACSATIANPAQHIETLSGIRPTVVDEDGELRGIVTVTDLMTALLAVYRLARAVRI